MSEMRKDIPWEPALTNMVLSCVLFLFLKCGLAHVHICEVQGLQAFNAFLTYISSPVLFLVLVCLLTLQTWPKNNKNKKRPFANLRVEAGDTHYIYTLTFIHSTEVIKSLLIIQPWTAGNVLANKKSLPSWDLETDKQVNDILDSNEY